MGGVLRSAGKKPSPSRPSGSTQRRESSRVTLNKRLINVCLDENELVRLSLDERSFVFVDGTWCADLTAKDYRKLTKQSQLIAAENNLLRIKLDVLLYMATASSTDDTTPKASLARRRSSLKSVRRVGYATPIIGDVGGRLAAKSSSASTDTLSAAMEGVIFGIGDPLLDIIADVPMSFLERYSLVADRGYLLTDDLKQLPAELLSGSFEVHRIPGGSELNCLKMIQRLIGVPRAATFLGSIGRDANGDVLEQVMTLSGVNVIFQRHPTEPTGVCYICVTDVQRTMVTDLGAARSLRPNSLEDPKVWSLVEKAKYFYVEAYSLSNRFDEAMKLAGHALQRNKMFAMNLSSVYLCKKYVEKIVQLLLYVDLLFGSDAEALAFSEAKNLQAKDIEEIAMYLARSPKANGRRGRLVVLTRGGKPAIAVEGGRLRPFPVVPIETEHIRDTVGAGDTFVGGYLAALIMGSEHEERMDSGMSAAHYMIRQRGCSFDLS